MGINADSRSIGGYGGYPRGGNGSSGTGAGSNIGGKGGVTNSDGTGQGGAGGTYPDFPEASGNPGQLFKGGLVQMHMVLGGVVAIMEAGAALL